MLQLSLSIAAICDFQPALLSLKVDTTESQLLLVILRPKIFGVCLSTLAKSLLESEMRWCCLEIWCFSH